MLRLYLLDCQLRPNTTYSTWDIPFTEVPECVCLMKFHS